MIKIFHPRNGFDIKSWQERLDQVFLKYEFILEDRLNVPRLVDGEIVAEGLPAMESYLESQEQFLTQWYEDRCDKYEYDPDAPPQINGI